YLGALHFRRCPGFDALHFRRCLGFDALHFRRCLGFDALNFIRCFGINGMHFYFCLRVSALLFHRCLGHFHVSESYFYLNMLFKYPSLLQIFHRLSTCDISFQKIYGFPENRYQRREDLLLGTTDTI
ncbi:hypothetical protein L9F63_013240, partial [Diploptera punctata]